MPTKTETTNEIKALLREVAIGTTSAVEVLQVFSIALPGRATLEAITSAAASLTAIERDDYADSQDTADEGGWGSRAAAHESFIAECHDDLDSLLRTLSPPTPAKTG